MIIVHVGMAKAGSSLLQHFLARNVDKLEREGVLFPDIGRQGVAHHPLSKAAGRSGARDSDEWTKARQYFEANRSKKIIISSEGFEAVDAEALSSCLSGHDVKIVCYVRDTTSRLPSFYTQNTKFGLNTLDFDTFFKKMRIETSRKWLYAKFAKEWAQEFGSSNVRLRSLEAENLIGGSLVSDFLSVAGIGSETIFDAEETDESLNESPAWQTVEALRAMHTKVTGGSQPNEIISDLPTWRYLKKTFQVASDAALKIGWSDRGLYLSEDQNSSLVSLYNNEVSLLESMNVDARILPIRLNLEKNRKFLPSISEIPPKELSEFFMDVHSKMTRFLLRNSR